MMIKGATARLLAETENAMRVYFLFPLLVIAGCASSGPVPIGKDTYMITKQSAAGVFKAPSEIKAEIIREGNAFCAATGKTLQIVNSNETPVTALTNPSAEIQFMCLADGDKDLTRPKMRKSADTVIEVRKE